MPSLWHIQYMGNSHNSDALSGFLLNNEVHTSGTLWSNRGEPVGIKNPNRMITGGVATKGNGKMLAFVWKDKRMVKVISI